MGCSKDLSGPTRAMPPQRAMGFESQTPQSLVMHHWEIKGYTGLPQGEIAATHFYDSGGSLGKELGEELGEIFCAFSCFICCAE